VVAPDDLEEPERLLWRAYARGAWVDLRSGEPGADDPAGAQSWGKERIIRAEVIQSLLLGVRAAEPGAAPAIRLRGARIVGRLDLMGATVSRPLVCEHCSFDEEIRLVEATTRTVRIVKSSLPGLNGSRMRLNGILNLWACVITGVLRLDQAKITGQLCLREASIGAPGGSAPGPTAVAADALDVDGGVDFVRLHARGLVSVEVATVTGSVDLTEAKISCRGERALVMSNAVIGGRLDGRGLQVEGEMVMQNCRVAAAFIMSAARLSNPDGVALSAGGLTVDGGVFLTRGFVATGEIRMVGARLGANLSLPEATLSNPAGIALNLDLATIGTCLGAGITCAGQVTLTGTRIAGDLDLTGARLETGADRPALIADGATVDGLLVLRDVRARGEISLRTVRVGQRILLMDAELDNPGGVACRLSRAQVSADVFCGRMIAAGSIRLSGATIGSSVLLNNARLRNPAGNALEAAAMHAAGLSLELAEPSQGLVDLQHAQIGLLRDDPDCWPDQLRLDGLTYQALEPRLPARQRLRWLASDPRGHQPQPYEQLAAHYNSIGQPAQALRVLYARERNQRRAMAPLARAWSRLQDLTVGYGYQPWRALVWLALLLAAGSVAYAIDPPPPLQPSAAPHFNPVVYTLDLLLPVVDLGQKHAFNPTGADQWFSYLLIAAGWILVTTVAAGAARVLSRR
jgi:hypothetical protein